MSNNGMNVGGSSVVLVFAVLCLTIFALISLSQATADKALADSAARVVKGFYDAEAKAETILEEALTLEPGSLGETVNVQDVEVTVEWDGTTFALSFACHITDNKELFVQAVIHNNDYEIQVWHMRDSSVWMIEEALPLFQGQ